MRAVLGVLLVCVAPALAGCLGSEGDSLSHSQASPTASTGDGSQVAPGPAPPEDRGDGGAADGGAIRGQTLDDEQRPLPEVEIEVFSRSGTGEFHMRLRSNDTGAFVADRVPAGGYLVYASRQGFELPGPRSVDVVAGQEATVTIELVPLPSSEPFTDTRSLTATSQLHLYVTHGLPAVAGQRITNGTQVVGSNLDIHIKDNESARVETLLVEMTWTNAQNVCPHAGRFDLYSPGERISNVATSFPQDRDSPYYWGSLATYEQPVHYIIPRRGDDPDAIHSPWRNAQHKGEQPVQGMWEINLDRHDQRPPEGGTPPLYCSAQAKLEAYVTIFYNAPIPSPEWTYLE